MTRIKAIVLFGIVVLVGAVGGQAPEKKIAMTPVTYDGLKQEVLKHRGKVVVVDFWASWCFNCIKGFPHIQELQKKYADKGLVVISVSLDDPKNSDAVELANKTLNRVNSTFRNVHLTDTMPWQDRFGISSIPCYYIFDRNGRWIKLGGSDDNRYTHEEIEKTVVQMLNEK